MTDPALVSPAELAAEWRCSTSFVRRACRTGELPAVRLGRLIRIQREAIVDYLARRTIAPGGDRHAQPQRGQDARTLDPVPEVPRMSEPTAREEEVYRAFRRHGSRKCAAAELGITDGTAKVHLRRLRRRLRQLGRDEAEYFGVIPQDRAAGG